MSWAPTLLWLIIGCQFHVATANPTGHVDGVWVDGIAFRGAVVIPNAPFHEGRDAIVLTTWANPGCDDLRVQDGHRLEVPLSAGRAVETARLFACRELSGGHVCDGAGDLDVSVIVSRMGPHSGDPVTGEIVADEGSVSFDVQHCGPA